MGGKPTVTSTSKTSYGGPFSNSLDKLQLNGWLLLLDLGLILIAFLMVFSDAKILAFHVVFMLLTLGAFFWKFYAFAMRAVFWVTVTTIVVALAIFANEVHPEEFVEIPLLTSILVLVFAIAGQRSRAEQALRQSEEKYSTLFENLFKESLDAIFIANKEGKIADVNQAVLSLFGNEQKGIIGLNYQDVFIPAHSQHEFELKIAENGFVRNHEVELHRGEGIQVFALLSVSVWHAPDGNVLGYQGIVRDITQSKQAEQSLRESEERYRHLVELSFEGIAVHSKGRFLHLNSPVTTILGATSPAELMGKPVIDFVHPDYLDIVRERIQQMNNEGLGAPLVEEKFLRLDGTSVDVEIASVPITYQGQPAIQSVIRDITARKEAEMEREHLLATEHKQRLLAETLGEVFLSLAAQTSYETVLDEILSQAKRVVSFSAANIMLLHEDTLRIARHQGYHKFESRTLVLDLEQSLADFPLDMEVVQSQHPLVIPDTQQNPHWVTTPESNWIRSFIAVPICLRDLVLGLLRLDSDTPNRFSANDVKRLFPLANAAAIALENARLYDKARQEIEERIQIEKELRQIAAKNQAILDAIPDSIFHTDRDGRILDHKIPLGNALTEVLKGIEFGKKLGDIPLLPPDLVDLFLHYITKTLDSGTTQIFEYQIQLPQDIRDIEVWLVTGGLDEVLAIVRDVTERKAREAVLEQERSRIARDLHDLLGQSLGYLRLKLDEFSTKDELSEFETIKHDLAQMCDVANEAYEVVRNIIAAARLSNSSDLAEVMLAQAKLVGRRASFEVNLFYEGQVRSLTPVVQQQVLYILQEALSNVEKHAQAKKVDINLAWTEDMLRIRMIDDGCGFETNVPRTNGHYGLTIMQERADEIQGLLSITSQLGIGTTLTLQLPIAPISDF